MSNTKDASRATFGSNQKGLVSIIVTLIMMIVISLIVIGFATVTRRNQRETLDRQLSTQAYYAAETGVNDAATAVIKNKYTPQPSDATDCTGGGSFMNHTALNLKNTLKTGVGYTCLLVTQNLPNITENLTLGSSKVVKINPSAATNLKFSWSAKGVGNTDASGCPAAFTTVGAWTATCPYGVLKVDLYADTGSNTADAMAANTATVYLQPFKTGPATTSINYNNPIVVHAICAGSTCSATLTAPAGATFAAGSSYYARLTNAYEDSGNVTITPTTSGVTFSGAGLQIDATGKAQDVLRRVQVRIPPDSSSLTAVNALGSGGKICKQFSILGPGASADPAALCP